MTKIMTKKTVTQPNSIKSIYCRILKDIVLSIDHNAEPTPENSHLHQNDYIISSKRAGKLARRLIRLGWSFRPAVLSLGWQAYPPEKGE